MAKQFERCLRSPTRAVSRRRGCGSMAPRRWHCLAPGAIAALAPFEQRRACAAATTADLRTCLRSLVFAAALLLAGQVDAQVSASVAALSDYRFRGISQSDRKPALQASLAFDHATGLFASAFASSVDLGSVSNANVETVLAAGYAASLRPDLSWEAGVAYYRYPGSRAARETDYIEVFAGVTWRDVNARLYVAPDYFGGGRREMYAELNATFALSERFAVSAHAGFGRVTGRYSRIDVRTSISIDLRHATLELAAVATDIPSAECPLGAKSCRPGIVAVLSRSF
jgi:uncharacterized protein (TIGR02001 family)